MRNFTTLVLWSAALFLLATVWGCGPPADGPEPAGPDVVRPEPPRPVPESLREQLHAITELREKGNYAEAAKQYPVLLEKLAKAWGQGDDGLKNYHYDYCLALKLAGRSEDCLKAVALGLNVWPQSLQLLILDVATRAPLAIAQGRYDRRVDETFRRILAPENLPRVRGLRVDPASLYGQWAELLHRSGRFTEALEKADAGLALSPRSRGCRATRGKLLVRLKRPREALPILESLIAEKGSVELELFLGTALQQSGDSSAAWKRFEGLLKRDAENLSVEQRDELLLLLRSEAAKSLIDLGRRREALDVLFELLERFPDNATALHQLATAVRGLGAREGAKAIDRRIRSLARRESFLKNARAARTAGFLSSASYYNALASTAVDRTGEALSFLQQALQLTPQLVEAHLETARVRLLLGRLDTVERGLRDALKRVDSPVLAATLARVLVRRGRVEEARTLLTSAQARPPEIGEGTSEGDATLARVATVLRALAFLSVGDPSQAEKELDSAAGSEPDVLLCRAELAVFQRRFEEAERILQGSFVDLPGGPDWAGALRSSVRLHLHRDESTPEEPSTSDPSDWLDHPRLFLRSAADTALTALHSVHARRMKILDGMRGYADRDVVDRWHELLDLYLEVEARRKAREVAWFLHSLRPNGVTELRGLARALSRPEDVVSRIVVCRLGLERAPADRDLEGPLREAEKFLGLR